MFRRNGAARDVSLSRARNKSPREKRNADCLCLPWRLPRIPAKRAERPAIQGFGQFRPYIDVSDRVAGRPRAVRLPCRRNGHPVAPEPPRVRKPRETAAKRANCADALRKREGWSGSDSPGDGDESPPYLGFVSAESLFCQAEPDRLCIFESRLGKIREKMGQRGCVGSKREWFGRGWRPKSGMVRGLARRQEVRRETAERMAEATASRNAAFDGKACGRRRPPRRGSCGKRDCRRGKRTCGRLASRVQGCFRRVRRLSWRTRAGGVERLLYYIRRKETDAWAAGCLMPAPCFAPVRGIGQTARPLICPYHGQSRSSAKAPLVHGRPPPSSTEKEGRLRGGAVDLREVSGACSIYEE